MTSKTSRRRRTTVGFTVVMALARPGINLLLGKEHRGLEKLPEDGYIAVANHLSEVDPVAVGHAVYNGGNTPHFMAKDSLFRVPGLGQLMRGLKQIPVARGDRQEVKKALDAAQEVLDFGGTIIVYPEGTLTRDPELWPMRMKTGAARLALSTGVPLVPIVHWGAHRWMPRGATLPRLFPRKKYTLQVGDPVDLRDLRGRPMSRALLAEATERVEAALTQGLAHLRDETPPEDIWDRALNRRVPRSQLRAKAEQLDRAALGEDAATAGKPPPAEHPASAEETDR